MKKTRNFIRPIVHKSIPLLLSILIIKSPAFSQDWITDPFSQPIQKTQTNISTQIPNFNQITLQMLHQNTGSTEVLLEKDNTLLGKGCPVEQNQNYQLNYDYQQYLTPEERLRLCIEQASLTYNINPLLLWGIAKVESNFNPYALNRNKNGSYDIGIMQINSSHLKTLEKYGLTDKRYIWEPCYNIFVGAWILSKCIQKHGYTWDAIGCYNAATPWKRKKYSYKVYKTIEPYLKPYTKRLK